MVQTSDWKHDGSTGDIANLMIPFAAYKTSGESVEEGRHEEEEMRWFEVIAKHVHQRRYLDKMCCIWESILNT